ncbi:MAG: hypothetical protein HQ541_22680 [Mariniphaga sp.]|nr:hypothetical protein [Mariniphaga sp.]
MKIVYIVFLILCTQNVQSQCLSAVNPVGGSTNLLVLEKHTLRFITFYRFNYGNRFFENAKHADFDLIKNANYNYLGYILGYGITNKLTLETELGYFINKTQKYNIDPEYSLTGSGFSNAVVSAKFGLFKDNFNRRYLSVSMGAKIPFTTKPQIVDGVELPIEVQPSNGAYGIVLQSFFVKENSERGLRYFVINRFESNFRNPQEYRLGSAFYTSFFISKHLMFPWLKGDWTAIIQLRNEIRGKDKIDCCDKESTGSILFFVSPQINYYLKEKWNFSAMLDIPVYQNFRGTQLGTKMGITFNVARDFPLIQQ